MSCPLYIISRGELQGSLIDTLSLFVVYTLRIHIRLTLLRPRVGLKSIPSTDKLPKRINGFNAGPNWPPKSCEEKRRWKGTSRDPFSIDAAPFSIEQRTACRETNEDEKRKRETGRNASSSSLFLFIFSILTLPRHKQSQFYAYVKLVNSYKGLPRVYAYA